ncbi:MAG: hypothetical protein ISR65_16610 [Bacteriovoracaceae bacterium]|nr:hypothetical protein [Bacteriovoracaceae bacterium]
MKKIFASVLLSIVFCGQLHALDCFGTEPFWGAKVSDSSVELNMMDNKISTFPILKTLAAAGMTSKFLKVYSDNRGPVATVISQKCNDGMSDIVHPKEVVIYTPTAVLYGCCR